MGERIAGLGVTTTSLVGGSANTCFALWWTTALGAVSACATFAGWVGPRSVRLLGICEGSPPGASARTALTYVHKDD